MNRAFRLSENIILRCFGKKKKKDWSKSWMSTYESDLTASLEVVKPNPELNRDEKW